MYDKNIKNSGFTLVELSIVLVVIALIVAGVVVGQALIRSSEIRGAVSQLSQYSTAVNTFRSKYAGFPGDLNNAATFGFDAGRGASPIGNNLIESGAATAATFENETSCFWDDLTFANLISESLNQSVSCEQAQTPALLGAAIPISKIGLGNYIVVGSNNGANYFWLTGVNSITAGVYDLTDNLTAADASSIDLKMDDGLYNNGNIQAFTGNTAETLFADQDAPAVAAANVCIVATGYNFTTDSGSDQGCQLRFRPDF